MMVSEITTFVVQDKRKIETHLTYTEVKGPENLSYQLFNVTLGELEV